MHIYPVVPKLSALFALICGLVITTLGCAMAKNTTYNLLTRVEVDGTKEFDFVIGADLIKDLGGDENKVVNDLLRGELYKRQYCERGYAITFRGVSQGGGYLLYKGRCHI